MYLVTVRYKESFFYDVRKKPEVWNLPLPPYPQTSNFVLTLPPLNVLNWY